MSTAAAAPLHDDAAYRALTTHDARFDGRLFVGVTSTGIYCRPVCRVKAPRRENCRFFANAALAEHHGFRPCLRCRPELAPGLSLTDSSAVLADQAARWLVQAAHDGQDPPLPALAARLGVTDRHLRRVFTRRHGVGPLAWLTTQRLLLAKQLLTDTALPVTEVALATGFGSLRRFNAAFAERYRLSPSALRREGAAEPGALRLAWRPPFDLAGLLGFIARRAVPGQEVVDGLTLRRTLAVAHQGQLLAGWLSARFVPERCELHLSVAPALRPVLGPLLQRTRHAFDLDADPALIDPVLVGVPGTPREGQRLPGSWDGFETAVRVVLGQQVSVAAARTLAQRLVQRFGTPLATPFADLDRLFPSAAQLAAADAAAIGTLGIVRQRVGALQALARAVVERRLQLQPGADLSATLAALTALPGIGDWSAQLIALRALAWPDAWPASDIGLLKALGTRDVAAATALAEAWRPWRGYAVFKLWLSLETPP
jgi:AraC family transcriptional regulator of adaptative response / DNA-3-methyladenine glycosylase II